MGGFGAHKFYLRKPWWGVLYVVFFWIYIPALAALVEFIVYACTDSERLNEKYESAGGASTAIIVVIAALIGISLIGILAAIALPAYQDYTVRARAMSAMQAVEPLQAEVELFMTKNGRLPTTAGEVGAAPQAILGVAAIALQDEGLITITFLDTLGQVGGQTIEVAPILADGRLTWRCTGGTAPAKYRPPRCR